MPEIAVRTIVGRLDVHAVKRSGVLLLGDQPHAGIEETMVLEIQLDHPLATNHGLQRIRIRFDLGIDRLDISHARAFAHRIDRRQSRSRIAFGLPVQRLGVVQQDLGIAEQRPRYGLFLAFHW